MPDLMEIREEYETSRREILGEQTVTKMEEDEVRLERGDPLGLRGEAIPLVARIVNVADTFDAMTTNRPYQKAMSVEMAVARLKELSGTAHDPYLVSVVADLHDKGQLKN